LKAAYHISRPYYIDAEDLVQEAFIKIYRNRDKYDGNLNASLKTWLVNVALRHFYSIAITEYRMKRVPQGMHLCKSMVSIDNNDENPILSVSSFNRPFIPYDNEIEYELRYKEIIERTELRLKPFARKVFSALLEPPQQLIDKVFQSQKQFIANRESGISTKVPFQFSITAQHLAEYFGVPKYKITKTKNTINDAIKKAIED
jgi:RNA polymerase sigma factor (sigma-70 family)